MIQFIAHPGLEKELVRMERKIPTLRQSIHSFELLCEHHFHPESPRQCIAPAKLHRVTQNATWTMWKTELVLVKSGLRPNQFPRVCFAVSGATIAFLCIASHVENYDDGDMDRFAAERVTDML